MYRKNAVLFSFVAFFVTVAMGFALFSIADSQDRSLWTSAAMKDGVPVPIIMYHSVLKDRSRSGTYVVTPDTIRSDLEWLSENGYETISMTQLIDYVKYGGELPEKPVVLTFDDGYLNNLTYVLPMLEEFDMCAVVSVVGTYVERFSENHDSNLSYAHLTWQDIITLNESGRVEIGNHSYDMHSIGKRKGSMKTETETMSQYRETFIADTLRNQNALLENCGIEPNVYTYPYGHITKESVEYLTEMGFEAALTCYEYVNYISADPAKLMKLGRFNRPSGISTASFMEKVFGKV